MARSSACGRTSCTRAAAAATAALQVLDVREQREWDAGHIPGSVHTPYHDIRRGSGRDRSGAAGGRGLRVGSARGGGGEPAVALRRSGGAARRGRRGRDVGAGGRGAGGHGGVGRRVRQLTVGVLQRDETRDLADGRSRRHRLAVDADLQQRRGERIEEADLRPLEVRRQVQLGVPDPGLVGVAVALRLTARSRRRSRPRGASPPMRSGAGAALSPASVPSPTW